MILEKVKKFAEGMDALRIWPRLFIGMYLWLLHESATWFMLLENPNNAQAGLVSAVIAAGAAWFMAYVNSGKKKKDE